VAQVVEHLCSECEALSSNPSTAETMQISLNTNVKYEIGFNKPEYIQLSTPHEHKMPRCINFKLRNDTDFFFTTQSSFNVGKL
jgi:hypothetical protein